MIRILESSYASTHTSPASPTGFCSTPHHIPKSGFAEGRDSPLSSLDRVDTEK